METLFSWLFCFSVKTHFEPSISQPLALEGGGTFQVFYSNSDKNSDCIPKISKFASGPVMASSNDEGIVSKAAAVSGVVCSSAQLSFYQLLRDLLRRPDFRTFQVFSCVVEAFDEVIIFSMIFLFFDSEVYS